MTSLLRFITCGSVDDGKSTLIGRLLHDCGAIPDDQLAAVARDSERYGTTGAGNLDMALLVDGLAAEREQGITIDVAYRYFGTARRRFIVADTPGHEQYTRNMATGASNADAAIVLVDARKGLLPQTRRHSFILSLMGVRQVMLAVNKMDAIGWDQARFDAIAADYRSFAGPLGFSHIHPVPLSALTGDNVTQPSRQMPWYQGPPLLDLLETAPVSAAPIDHGFRFPVQYVLRPDSDFRGVAGTITAGYVQPGDNVRVLPSGRTSTVARIITHTGDLDQATAGQAVTLVLTDDVDVTRGDLLTAPKSAPEISDQFTAHLIWMHDQPLLPGRAYLLRLGTATATAQVTQIKHRVDINNLGHLAAHSLGLNDVGLCNLALDRPLPIEPYADNKAGGGFILIDRHSNATLACGMVQHGLRRAGNIHRQAMRVGKQDRVTANGHGPCVLWFTGLSGAGKSTIADLVEQRLHQRGCRTMSLDGDNIRHGLCRDLGFTAADRVENIRRVAHVAQLMTEAGLIVLVSLISPFRADREMARSLLPPGEFLEIFVDTALAVCETRDVKGLYRKARSGSLPNFTGIDSPYELPLSPDLHLETGLHDAQSLADQVLAHLADAGIISAPRREP